MKKIFNNFNTILGAFVVSFIIEVVILFICIIFNTTAAIIVAYVMGAEILVACITVLIGTIISKKAEHKNTFEEYSKKNILQIYEELKKQAQARSDYKQFSDYCAEHTDYIDSLPTLKDLKWTPLESYYSEFLNPEGQILLYMMKETWSDFPNGLRHPLDKEIAEVVSRNLVDFNGNTSKTHEIITKYPWLISPF